MLRGSSARRSPNLTLLAWLLLHGDNLGAALGNGSAEGESSALAVGGRAGPEERRAMPALQEGWREVGSLGSLALGAAVPLGRCTAPCWQSGHGQLPGLGRGSAGAGHAAGACWRLRD